MSRIQNIFAAAVSAAALFGCTVIRPGEVALKVRYGRTEPGILMPGPHSSGIFGTRIQRFNTRTIEYSTRLNFHSTEGIEVSSEITILYHINPDSVVSIFKNFDDDYQTPLISNNLIAIVRRQGLNHKAIELVNQRNEIERGIRENLVSAIAKHGFEIDLVLIKEIELPNEVRQAILGKLTAEQVSKKTDVDMEIKRKNLDYEIEKQKKEAELEITKQRLTLDFAIEKQKKESERLLIESQAIKKSQDILNSSITERLIKFKALEITAELVKSPNTKIIITDGKSPVYLSDR